MNRTASPPAPAPPVPLTSPRLSRDDYVSMLDERSRAILERRRRSRVRGRGWLVRRMLLAADVVGLTIAFLVAQLALEQTDGAAPLGDTRELVLFLALLPVWVLGAKIGGLYDRDEERTDHSTTDDLVGVFVLVTLMTWFYTRAALVAGFPMPNMVRLTLFWAVAIPAIAIGRSLARTLSRRHVAYVQNTLVVGAGAVGQAIAHKALQHPEYGMNVVGFIDSQPMERREDLESLTVLGALHDLPWLVGELDVERVIVAFSRYSDEEVLAVVRALKDMHVQIDVVPRLFDVIAAPADVHTVEGLPLVGLPPPRLGRSSLLVKRTFDIVASSVALVFLAPVLLVIAILIKVDSKGPVLFLQPRMGCNGRVFRICKFRTMTVDAEERKAEVAHLNRHARPGGDARMTKIPDDPRVTRVGRVLRRLSVDELPQLLNVLDGDMSLVGPRPLILDEDLHVTDWARRRVLMRPGITGPWQVLGSSNIGFEDMVKLDYRYVSQWSLFLDVKLILRTIPAVLRSRTANR